MKYAIPFMRKQKYGRILLCSSPALGGGPLKQAEYVAANAGVVGLTYAAALELHVDGITANCFAPGALTRASYELDAARLTHDSPILVPGKTFMETAETPGPEYVAPFMVYLASEKSAKINGTTFFLVGNMIGMYAHPHFEKTLRKDAKEPWELDELLQKIETELIPGYKSIVD
jgi:3-oxoacyl-[acyl-carrier protein] reductase